MRIATLSIGDELLLGETVDTNTVHIAGRLYAHGLVVTQHRTTGDNVDELARTLTDLASSHDAVVATGGLGPTSDDVTAAAAAQATYDRLVMNPDAHAHLEEFFRERGRELFPQNMKQALLPAGASIIANPSGTACGFQITLSGCALYFLPGVPSEMRPMLEEGVIPHLLGRAGQRPALKTKTLKLFGISEARIASLVAGLPLAGVTLAYRVTFPIVQLKLRVATSSANEAAQRLAEACILLREHLGDYLVAEDDGTMESEVARLLTVSGRTVAVAESCSGGLLAASLTDIPGSSAYFRGGVVAYANETKTGILAVSPATLDAHGAVSAAVAAEMARGARQALACDLALAVTGIAGPAGGSADKPVGTVFLGLAGADGSQTRELHLAGSRGQVRSLTVCHALDWLRRTLIAAGESAPP